jgi:hypothetical protein
MVPESAYSAASIAKAFLGNMGIIPPSQKFWINDVTYGICMQGYYGGRAEIRIRKTEVPTVYLDFASQYPTVNTNLGLWDVLTAKSLHILNTTEQVSRFLQELVLDHLFDRSVWRKLNFFALVEPQDDILPVRTVYGQTSDQKSIGLNPLTSLDPVWYAGPDVVASWLLTRRVPKILKAIVVKPFGKQSGMRTIQLGDEQIDPYADDFFCKVVEARKRREKDDPLYYFLKILANAGCYGIYAELNREQTGKNDRKTVQISSGEMHRTQRSHIVEVPGTWYFPPVSALITAGGRLLLALLERMVTDAGGTYLMCDTDSMAVVGSKHGGMVPCNGGQHKTCDGRDAIKALTWEEVSRIVERFEALNPYDPEIVPDSILNIVEEINFDSYGKQRQIYGYGISAKRYALCRRNGQSLEIIKASEHGLGLYYRPKVGRDTACDIPMWIKEGWNWILCRALGLPRQEPCWFRLPVMRRIAISTPNVMTALRTVNRDQARPYNFALSPVLVNLSGQDITLLGSFEKNPARWRRMSYVNVHDGSMHKLDAPTIPVLPQTFDMVFAQYVRHPESKSLAPNGMPCNGDTCGLLGRYPVTASGFYLIGKETERAWEQSEDISTLTPSLVGYGSDTGAADEQLRKRLLEIPLAFLEFETRLSRHTIVRVRRGQPVHPGSLRFLKNVVRRVAVRN